MVPRMHKPSIACVGCDTAKKKVDVVQHSANGRLTHRTFANTRVGYRKLVDWLGKDPVRVDVEASGNRSLDLPLALHKAETIQI